MKFDAAGDVARLPAKDPDVLLHPFERGRGGHSITSRSSRLNDELASERA